MSRSEVSSSQGGVIAELEAVLESTDCVVEENGASIFALEVDTDLAVVNLQELDADLAPLIDWGLLVVLLDFLVLVIFQLIAQCGHIDLSLDIIGDLELFVRNFECLLLGFQVVGDLGHDLSHIKFGVEVDMLVVLLSELLDSSGLDIWLFLEVSWHIVSIKEDVPGLLSTSSPSLIDIILHVGLTFLVLSSPCSVDI